MPHAYPNAGSYTITATATTTANGTQYAAQPLGLDPTFNATGKLASSIPAGTDTAYATAVDSLGRILVAGVYNNGDFAVLRYNADGSPDTTFGAVNPSTGARTGYVKLDLSGNGTSIDKAYAIAIQPGDGKIVIAGTTNLYSATSGYDFVVARFTTDGVLDTNAATGFGTPNVSGMPRALVADDVAGQDGQYQCEGRFQGTVHVL